LKLLCGVLALLVLTLVIVDLFTSQVAKDSYIENLTLQLEGKGRLLGLMLAGPESPTPAEVRAMAEAAGGRITVIRSDGRVWIDSEANAAEMENHRMRPEVREALAGRPGSSIRHSATIGIDFLYVAVPWGPPGAVARDAIRVAVPLERVDSQVNLVRWKILVSTCVAFVPAFIIAALLARWISRRFGTIVAYTAQLAKGNFRARLPDDIGGEFGLLAHTLNDTASHLQSASEQLEREHTELEKVERVRKDFVINVSHELRTPLASIQGYTETLMDGALEDPENNMRFLGIIRHNAERLARLTEDLLTLSRVEQKRQRFEFAGHIVNGFLKEAFEIIRPLAEKNAVSLELDPAPEDAEAWCDSEAVSQILANLLDNAIKYTPPGGRITVGARPAGDFVEIYVRDTGIGIPEEDVPRLFERFYRVDKARSREMGGTGLGLSIVKHLVGAHKGTVRVESHVGRGSTFIFSLPRDEAALGRLQLNLEFTAS
jgi:two-component system phosphate regulon sensor histidine kinase PhoR